MRDVDPAFRQGGVGLQLGLEIWQINDSRPKRLEKSQHGQFFTEQAYIVLQTCSHPTGGFQHNIHCWSGACANHGDAATAAIKAVELNASLGGRAVQIHEKAGYESDRFLSYFKPCFIPLLNHNSAGHTTKTPYKTRMFLCEGKHVVRVKEVPCSRSSLNHDSIFVVDTQNKIFQFNGANTDMYEQAKALDVVQYLMDNFHKEKCPIGVIEDGKFVADMDSGEFWALFGGFAPLMKKMESGSQETELSSSKLHLIQDGQIKKTEASPVKKELLDTNNTYILECDKEVFTWMGHSTSLEDKKAAVLLAEELCSKKRDPHHTKLICVNEYFEPMDFRARFDLWPAGNQVTCSESGREKVAVLLKQRGFNIQGLLKTAPTTEKLQPMSSSGNLQVWCVDRGSTVCLPPSEMVKFNSSRCYVVLHSCSMNQEHEDFVYTWLGHQSSMDTRATAASHAKDVVGSFQGKAVEVQIFQDKEPKHFLSLFSKLIVTKDGETVGRRSLFQMHQSGPSKWSAAQISLVAASLNSSSCFFLQTGEGFFTWYGKFTSIEEQEATESMVHYLKPDAKVTILKEGSELQSFWSILGGRQVYQSHHEPTESARNPRLFSLTIHKDQLKATEVFNFTQEDFLSNEVMIVDCYTSVFVWVGTTASTTIKLKALEIGQRFLDLTARFEGKSQEMPIYRVQEGSEPLLFTSLFSWDSTKIKQSHTVFERKLLSLKGEPKQQQEQMTKTKKLSPLPNEKGFQPITDKAKNTQKVTFRTEQPFSKLRQPPKNKAGRDNTAGKSSSISGLYTMFELQNGREAPPNTPIVKLPTLSLKPKRPIRETPPPTPCSRTTPRTAISPAIASLTCVYESYNDRFAFAWPGMKLRHEERALSRDVDAFDFESVEVDEDEAHQQTPASPSEAQVDMAEETERQCYHSYERLKVSSGNPVLRIDSSKRESYLSNEEFQQVFLMDKDTFYKLPKWKQDKYKMLLDLF
ncbi:hypothetical protein GOP47_0006050 [Adiantum capillus-veneris]|uniref:HP domain-containing protein n=1 Tax=Adiantum capillus-veneris TaxID=13818 RepID=A0A9D4V2I3_ADICA|nr:hypothetical protein GOP47_0006050 [Adiantum capillus-veneris]